MGREMTLWGRMRQSLAQKLTLTPLPESRSSFWPMIRDWYPGAWQNNDELSVDTQASYFAVYACVTLIQNDFGKIRQKLVERVGGIGKVWRETSSPAFSPFLRKPNRYQNHIQFKQWWANSKLFRGNTYALKERDARGIVVAEYILNPDKVTPLVTPDGSVYYQLGPDNLSGLQEGALVVPASEIIHDRMNCLFHPLVGVSPLYAAGIEAAKGLNIQNQSRTFFGNGARPSGVLTAPNHIPQDVADRAKVMWEQKFSGNNAGRIAVLGDGLKYEPMTMSAVDAQVIQQLEWSAIAICAAFHVPPWKIGIGPMPTYSNGELMNQQYYDECLQVLIEEYELCQDFGLGIGEGIMVDGRELGVELDLTSLLRMDTAAKHQVLRENVRGSLMTINEARLEMDMPPVEGGDTIWMQQQNYSVEALMERDRNDPFAKPEPQKPDPPAPSGEEEEEPSAELALALLRLKSPGSFADA